jgi:C4-dicarboxylate-specific signal transduction histidine kinase
VALGEISAGIAHELMQPLNALKIGLANLRRRQTSGGAETPEEAAARFDRLERQVSRAGDVVHTMRLLGRQSDLKLSPVAIDDLLEEAFQLFDRPLAVLGITLAVERPSDELFVLAHPQFLLQVLINLLANARDALEDGTEDDADRRVHLSVGTDGTGRVVVEVRDNGPGIPPHLMDRVVEPFFTTKAPGKGMGLGLALSNRLVLLFGGTLEFGNQAAGGAFFRIGLRRAVAAMESNTRQARAGRDTPRQRDPGQGA